MEDPGSSLASVAESVCSRVNKRPYLKELGGERLRKTPNTNL